MELDNTTIAAKQMAEAYTQFLHNPDVYPLTQPPTKINNTALSKEDERKVGTTWVTIPREKVKATIYSFKVPEPQKMRCRVVHACAINTEARESARQPPKYKLRSPAEINEILARAILVTQFDARSMYDQFELSEEVRCFFSFKTRENIIAALTRMPMGFMHSCGIAQSLSILVAEFTVEDNIFYVYIIVHLDNYCYAFVPKENTTHTTSDLKAVAVKTISTFLKRSVEVDLQLNELDREEIISWLDRAEDGKWESILQMSPTTFTFLGVTYNLQNRTKTAAEKSWNKLDLLMKCVFPNNRMNPSTTPRQLAMLIGTLQYIRRNAEVRHKFHNLHRNLAELAYTLWVYPQGWDIELRPVTFMFEEIIALYNIVKSTRVSRIYPPIPQKISTFIAITDASAIGWGGIICDQKNKTIRTHADFWPKYAGKPDPIYESSTIAEPQAIKETLMGRVPAEITHVTIVTDHSPLVSAAKSYQARGYAYFELLAWLEAQHYSYNIIFIPGHINIADGPSRNPTNLSIDEEEAWKICAAAGMGYARALMFPLKELLPSVCVDALNANYLLLS